MIMFTIIHYIVHKNTKFKISHFKYHHDCDFNVGLSRCAIAAEGYEALFRDLLSAYISTYIIGLFGYNFYGYIWIIYYSLYSLWAMYVHTGKNKYHLIHHTTNPQSNYGLYYISDFLIGTLYLK